MDLRRKLARLRAPRDAAEAPTHPEAPTAPPPDDELRARLVARRARRRDAATATAPTPTPWPFQGTPLRHAFALDPEARHGDVSLHRALAVRGDVVATLALDPALRGFDPARALFLDTETTGLAGGTGTVAFLVGLACFEGRALRLEQLLLDDLDREPELLAHVAARIRDAGALVTFNGRTFDLPLLRARFVMARVAPPPEPPHLDLLHVARRIYGARVERCTLTTLERDVLNFTRVGDIDGAEIPERFWAFVRGADASGLAPVLEHNVSDLVALAAIVVALAERWDAVLPSHAPEDVLGVARTALRAGDTARAGRWAEAAAEAGGDDALACEALRLSAHVHRRHADPAAALAALDRALDRTLLGASGALAPRLQLERSKLLEHRLRAFGPALDAARGSSGAEPPEGHARRLARLEAKLRKASRA